jgi:hypothetical protein
MAHRLLCDLSIMEKLRFVRTGTLVAAMLLWGGAAHAATTLTLAWDPSPEPVTGYVVYWGTQSGIFTQSMDVGKTTTATITPTIPNVSYFFVVKAYNAAGMSGPSSQVGAWYGTVSRTPSLSFMGDFDGDGKSDPTIYRGNTGEWYASRSSNNSLMYQPWGAPALGDIPVPADYDGDGKTDIAIYRGTTGQWFINQSRDGYRAVAWGAPAMRDLPVPADYDGDGKADIAIFRRATGEWFILKSTTGLLKKVSWGGAGDDDVPVPGDYDGNGSADIAVFRRSTGQWFTLFDGGSTSTVTWGAPSLGDVPVPADYDGDGKMDIGIFRETSGAWVIRRSSNGSSLILGWGAAAFGDLPIPGDYDGDGKADIAVFRSTTGAWYISLSGGGSKSFSFGAPSLGDTIGGIKDFVVLPLQ